MSVITSPRWTSSRRNLISSKMKAIELVRAMIYDSELAENGVTLRDYFGAVSHKGEMTPGNWFYVYPDSTIHIIVMPKSDPDVILQTEDAGPVFLWKVED